MSKKTNKITLIALLSALAYIVTLIKIPYPGAPWLKFDLSDIIVLAGMFIGGPIVGVGVSIIKNILDAIITGTTTGGLGETVAILSTLCLILPTYYITKISGKISLGLIVGVVLTTTLLTLANYFYITPFYAKLYNLQFILDMIAKKDGTFFKYVVATYGSFNLFKGVINSILYLGVHKRIK